MSYRRYSPPFIILVFILLLTACQAKGTGNGSGPIEALQANTETTSMLAAPFRAEATSAISVDLSWDEVEGATGYRIENSFANSDWFIIAEVAGEATSFEDFLAPSNMQLRYRLTPLLSDQEGKAFELTVTTPEIVPNPLTVVVTLEEPDYSSIGIDITGFDPSTFDPSTFDPASIDLSGIDTENLDLASLQPEPVSAMAYIGPEGGSLSVTGSNGVIYTLEIPPDAIDFSTYYVLTPVASIEGYPFSGGFFGAVQILPEGIVFDIPATLTIDVPDELLAAQPAGTVALPVAFAYQGSGAEFHLTPYNQDENALSSTTALSGKDASPSFGSRWKMIVPTKSTHSVGGGPATASEAKTLGKEHAPSNQGAAAEQIQALGYFSDEELAESAKDFQKAKQEKTNRSANRIEEALRNAQSLNKLTLVIYDLELLDKYDYAYIPADQIQELMDLAGSQLRLWLQPVDCPSPDAGTILMWAQRLLRPKTPFDIELKRSFSGGNFEAADNMLKAILAGIGCQLRFELRSQMIIGEKSTHCRYQLEVKASVPLSWKFSGSGGPDDPFLQGGAANGEPNLIYKLPIPILSTRDQSGYCTYVDFDDLNESDFTVIKLIPVFNSDGLSISDWRLEAYRPGGNVDKVTVTVTFPDSETTQTQPIPGVGVKDPWGAGLALITQEGVSTPGPLGLRHWEISTSGYYFWEGSGLYTKLENDHSHVTILNILPK